MKKVIKALIILILIITIILLYSHFIETQTFEVKQYKIQNSKITNNFNGFKIVHISDIHYGRMYNEKNLQKLVKSINKQKPDIIVLTGDLIDKDTNVTTKTSEKIVKELKKLNANIAKYAIKGNNDLKFEEWENIIENSGFTNLNNTYDTIYKNGYESILIAGISTEKDKQSIKDKLIKTNEYINSFETNGPIYKILLMHEPDQIDEINGFDLVLAGHSHAGQIRAPWGPIILPDGAKKYHEAYYKVKNTDLYISNGLGVSDYSFRLFNTPSYNAYWLLKNWYNISFFNIFVQN